MPPSIRPPTVVINKEAREKLIVHHHQNGSHLRLEPLTSEEAAAVEDTPTTSSTPLVTTAASQQPDTRAEVAWLQVLNDDANGADALPQQLDGTNVDRVSGQMDIQSTLNNIAVGSLYRQSDGSRS